MSVAGLKSIRWRGFSCNTMLPGGFSSYGSNKLDRAGSVQYKGREGIVRSVQFFKISSKYSEL